MPKYIAKKTVEFAVTPTQKINLTEGDNVAAPASLIERLLKHDVVEEQKETAIETAKEEPKEAEKPKLKGKSKKKETAKEEPKKD